jgi:hypothetical protein
MAFQVLPEDALVPSVSFYDFSVEGPLTSVAHLSGVFPRRFPDGAPTLFGIADAAGAAGAFQLSIAPLDATDLGALSAASPLDAPSVPLGSDQLFEIFQVTPEDPGVVTVTVSPHAELDAVLIARGPHLEEIETVDVGPAGTAETIDLVVTGDGPVFFEVEPAGGDTIETSVDLSLSLVAYLREREPNDDAATSHAVAPPTDVAGTLSGASDRDWYAVEIAGAGSLLAETSGPSAADPIDTRLVLLDTDGTTELAADDDGGEGGASRVVFDLPGAGTYYLVVESSGDAVVGGAYFLSVDVTLL